jgi:hypothetical protein
VFACANLPQMMHIARVLCGGQICVTPNEAAFAAEGSGQWQLAGRTFSCLLFSLLHPL